MKRFFFPSRYASKVAGTQTWIHWVILLIIFIMTWRMCRKYSFSSTDTIYFILFLFHFFWGRGKGTRHFSGGKTSSILTTLYRKMPFFLDFSQSSSTAFAALVLSYFCFLGSTRCNVIIYISWCFENSNSSIFTAVLPFFLALASFLTMFHFFGLLVSFQPLFLFFVVAVCNCFSAYIFCKVVRLLLTLSINTYYSFGLFSVIFFRYLFVLLTRNMTHSSVLISLRDGFDDIMYAQCMPNVCLHSRCSGWPPYV